MKGFIIGTTVSAWILGWVSLYMGWALHFDGLKLFIPLFGVTFAMLICAMVAVACVWQLCRPEKNYEEIAVYLVMGSLAAAPLFWTCKQYLSYLGPSDQFLLKLLTGSR